MTSQITFYLSKVIGIKIYDTDGNRIGRILDVLINPHEDPSVTTDSIRPRVVAIKTRIQRKVHFLDFSFIELKRIESKYFFSCSQLVNLPQSQLDVSISLMKNVQDKQIVDINGRKLVRVNDVRLVNIPSGTFVIAVDIGIEGLLRRIGIAEPFQKLLPLFKLNLPSKFILWDDVETFDHTNLNIKLSQSSSKLQTLHPSDLADIIEDLGKRERTSFFASLDEEKAADVLEELEPHAQVQIIESLPIEKAADVLEKMPADEVADLLDVLEGDKVEKLLKEMEKEASDEVRELLEYSRNEVGSLMTTDFLSFRKTMSIEETLSELRKQKPDPDAIYSLFITDNNDKLIGTVSIRDLVISESYIKLEQIMNRNTISVYDEDKIDSLAEIISKYNMLAIPVTDKTMTLQGMVVIDDIVEDLLDKRKTK
jgi:magnesium transporter